MEQFNALSLSHDVMSRHVKHGDFCIDATAGNGWDTLFLCELTGKTGKVIAFDIQTQAIENTRKRIEEAGFSDICSVQHDSHSNMELYAEAESASLVCFNFGWLPGGDHNINTNAATSIEAIRKGLDILRHGGLMSMCIYYGRETGIDERDAILEYVKSLDFRKYTVLECSFANRVNCPSIPVFIFKD